ncbi:hypothetical protein [Actinomyces procaprae]|uniref:hypothetical protein n=1 Tax=Actinomyces procaprae TaxID=2560010 RepID=UPI0010A28EA0|nr:hypothetical protein [Actinomyces procaprae]
MTIIVALLGGGGAVEMLRLAMQGLQRAQRLRHSHETALARERRRANEWETVARVSRAVAIDYGAPLADLPLGPGERPIRNLLAGDDDDSEGEEQS